MKTTRTSDLTLHHANTEKPARPSAISEMTAEHRHIERVIQWLQRTAAALDHDHRPDVPRLRATVEFLRVYADQRHHGREQALFFPLLVQRGVPAQGCPIGGLNHEHEKARALVDALDEWVASCEEQRPGADKGLQQTIQAIVELYHKHLWMEDTMVFPMAEKLVSGDDHRELLEKFADLDRTIGPDVVARLEQFARGLSVPATAAANANGRA